MSISHNEIIRLLWFLSMTRMGVPGLVLDAPWSPGTEEALVMNNPHLGEESGCKAEDANV
jgi:hypothetical protein